jgi:hypothetical protein
MVRAKPTTNMPNDRPIETIEEYEEQLRRAVPDMKKVVDRYPTDRAPQEILAPCLSGSENGRAMGSLPRLEQKAELNFGLIASKYLDDTDQDLAQRLHAIASFLLYWGLSHSDDG